MSQERQLTRLAELIRTHYIAYRTMWHQQRGQEGVGIYRPSEHWARETGSTKEDTWTKIARVVLEKKLDPALFIQRGFLAFQTHSRPPMPNFFQSESAVRIYKEYAQDDEHRIKTSLQSQTEKFKSEVRRTQRLYQSGLEEAIVHVLLDGASQLSPLFKYCVAVDSKADALAARFEVDAAVQYQMARSTYDRYWGSLIPDSFKSKSCQIYSNIMSA